MKKTLTVFALLLAVLLSSCKEDNDMVLVEVVAVKPATDGCLYTVRPVNPSIPLLQRSWFLPCGYNAGDTMWIENKPWLGKRQSR